MRTIIENHDFRHELTLLFSKLSCKITMASWPSIINQWSWVAWSQSIDDWSLRFWHWPGMGHSKSARLYVLSVAATFFRRIPGLCGKACSKSCTTAVWSNTSDNGFIGMLPGHWKGPAPPSACTATRYNLCFSRAFATSWITRSEAHALQTVHMTSPWQNSLPSLLYWINQLESRLLEGLEHESLWKEENGEVLIL